MGYIITSDSDGSRIEHTDGRYDVLKRVDQIQNRNGKIELICGGQVAIAFAASEVDEVNGDDPNDPTPLTDKQMIDLLAPLFPDATTTGVSGSGSSGGVQVAFNAAIPFNKDYSRMIKVVSGAIAFTPNLTGAIDGGGTLIKMYADGSHLPTFDAAFTKVSGNYVNTAGQINNILFINNAGDLEYRISQGTVVDIIPPAVLSVTVTDANTIDVHISETYTGTLGFSFDDGAPLTVTSRTAVGGNILRHVVSNTLTGGSVVDWVYTPGNIVDTATTPNAMAADSGTATNSITNVPSGVIAEYLTQEPTGTFYDTVGSYDLTNTGGLTSATPGLVRARKLIIGAGGAKLTNATLAPNAPGLSTAWSVTFWMKPFNTPGGPAPIMGRTAEWQLYYYVGGIVRMSVVNNSGGTAVYDRASSVAFAANDVHMVTVTFDGTNMNIYTDDALSNGSAATSGGGVQNLVYYDASNHFFIGDDGGGCMNGSLEDIRFFNRALTLSDVQTLWNGGAGM